ncbi:MAG: hypothetical protein ACK56I_04285, partial [bacterium]
GELAEVEVEGQARSRAIDALELHRCVAHLGAHVAAVGQFERRDAGRRVEREDAGHQRAADAAAVRTRDDGLVDDDFGLGRAGHAEIGGLGSGRQGLALAQH